MKTVYLWDSMDDQDRQNTMTVLVESTEWTIWKTKDKRWTPLLRQADYHQLLDIHKNKQSDCWGFKIKGWWRRGDIRVTKPKKSFEYWVKTAKDVPTEARKTLMEELTVPRQNAGKDEYIVDLEDNEKLYWLGTESGLIGAFGFAGACTAPVTLQRDQWERASVTSGPCNGILTHHCHNRSCKNSAFVNPAR